LYCIKHLSTQTLKQQTKQAPSRVSYYKPKNTPHSFIFKLPTKQIFLIPFVHISNFFLLHTLYYQV
jgi:hypothetical protein